MKRGILFLFFGLLTTMVWGQTPVRMTKNQSDCIGAYEIRDTVFGPVLSPIGFGNKLEIQGYELGNEHFIEQEHNTVWYKIKPPYNATMSLDIIPLNPEDDFDFLLFQNPGPNFCNKVKVGEAIPIRTNISRAAGNVGGRTGLSASSDMDYVPAGPGSPYSRAVEVKKGETYIMVVDNPFKANEGHTIEIHYKRKGSAKDRYRRQDPEEVEAPKAEMRTVRVLVFDAKTKEPVPVNVSILGLGEERKRQGVADFSFEGEVYRSYNVFCEQEGYLFTNKKLTVFRDDTAAVHIGITKIEPGVSIALTDIRFRGDEAEILSSSQKSLDQLLAFMVANPNVKVEIQGHVNAPGVSNKGKYKKLSRDRAQAVYAWLFGQGVERARMAYEGYGNSQPVYNSPSSEVQAQANRRVEVVILEL